MSEREPSFSFSKANPEGSIESVNSRAEWLRQHAVPLESINPEHEDFSDLKGVGEAISGAQIVMLGEANHGDGASFHAKSRLVKYLHQECGFDVLAFESGFYSCSKAWERLKRGDDPQTAFANGVFAVWSASNEMQNLIHYLAEQANTEHPLELVGFDAQFSGRKISASLAEDLRLISEKLDKSILDTDQFKLAQQAFTGLADSGQEANIVPSDMLAQWRSAILAFRAILDKTETSAALSDSELSFWRRVSEDAIVAVDIHIENKRGSDKAEVIKQTWKLRDSRMADNLTWLANDAYKEKKIIAWAASAHIQRNIPGHEAMGGYVYKNLGNKVYTVGFTSAKGEYHYYRNENSPNTIASPEPESLEDLFVRAGHANAFIDFKHLDSDGSWLREKIKARAFGHEYWQQEWPNVFDGMMFIETMHGATKYKKP